MIDYGSSILIEFPMIVDLDIGLIRVVDMKYMDEEKIYRENTAIELKLLKGLLMERTMVNPLQVAFIEENEEEMDTLYEKVMQEECKDVIAYSKLTNLYQLCRLFINSEGVIFPTILCRNYEEYKMASDLFADCNNTNFSVILKKEKDYDASAYTDVFVKNAEDLLYYDNLEGKNVFVANYVYNYNVEVFENESKIKTHPVMDLVAIANELRYVTLYDYSEENFVDDFYEEYLSEDDSGETELKNPEENQFIRSILGDVSNIAVMESDYDKLEDPYNEKEDEGQDLFEELDLNEDGTVDYEKIFATIQQSNQEREKRR